MKKIIVLAVIAITLFSCQKQARTDLAPVSKRVKISNLITDGLPGVSITASASGLNVSWSGLPDTVHVLQIAFCDNDTFNDSTYSVANLFLQNPVTSTVYPTSFTIPSDWFTGTKFIRIQGDYYVNSVKGGFLSNTITIP